MRPADILIIIVQEVCRVRRLLTWSYPHLLLSAGAVSAPAAIGRYLLLTRHSAATNRPPLLLSIDGTDGWTDTRPLHRFFSAYYLGSVSYISPVIFSRLTASYESVFIDWLINWLIWLIDWVSDLSCYRNVLCSIEKQTATCMFRLFFCRRCGPYFCSDRNS